jgi:D-alanyl-D-alanine carboxypeptidase (penicillin-binding protein 5/6)
MPTTPRSHVPSLRDLRIPGLPGGRWQRWLVLAAGLLLVAVLADVGAAWAARPWPAASVTPELPALPSTATPLAWPAGGQAAIGAEGYGVLTATATDDPRPIASAAKLITALAVLQARPLSPGEAGPTITVTPADAARYGEYLAEGGSVVPLAPGQELSEYQALQAMLIPSANNVADLLASWAYGSLPQYAAAANQLVEHLGMTETVVGSDASGLSPTTVSTAPDLVRLGEAALANPVLASICAQKSLSLPGGLTVTNTNELLGVDGIDGIKTGLTDQAGGVLVFAASHAVGGQAVTVVGAVMGAATLAAAFAAATALLPIAEANFATSTAVGAGQTVAIYHVPWQGDVRVVAQHQLDVLGWLGTPLRASLRLRRVRAPLPGGDTVGDLVVTSGQDTVSTPVRLAGRVEPAPGALARLFARSTRPKD